MIFYVKLNEFQIWFGFWSKIAEEDARIFRQVY